MAFGTFRTFTLVLAALLSPGCAREPKGTPTALEEPAENKSDLQGQWFRRALELKDAEQFQEALFAINASVALARECANEDTPACHGVIESHTPDLGGLGYPLMWRRRMEEVVTTKAFLLTLSGAPKYGLQAAEEAIAINDSFLPPYEAKAEALYALGKYDEALAAFRLDQTKKFRHLYAGGRIAHILLKQGKPDEAKAELEKTEALLAAINPVHMPGLTSPHGEVTDARAEIDAVRAELP